MIVQVFNTGAGGGKNFDVYMGAGGLGANQSGWQPPVHRLSQPSASRTTAASAARASASASAP